MKAAAARNAVKTQAAAALFRFVEQTIQRITVGTEAVTPQNINNRFEEMLM